MTILVNLLRKNNSTLQRYVEKTSNILCIISNILYLKIKSVNVAVSYYIARGNLEDQGRAR